MRKLPDRKTKQSIQKKQKSLGKKTQRQTRASSSLGWDAANDLLEWLWLELEARGITNNELKEATGIRAGTIESWQKTGRLPSLENMVSCVGFLGYELIPMRGIVHVKNDVYYHPIDQFRRKLLNDKLASRARAEGKTFEQYLAEQSSEAAEEAYKARRAAQIKALEPYDEELEAIEKQTNKATLRQTRVTLYRRRQLKAAKLPDTIRLPVRWNG